MEYFQYDYSNVKTEINFSNYANFIMNNSIYKYYMFDIALARLDNKISQKQREEATKITRIHKLLYILPYTFIFGSLIICTRRNIFKTNNFDREHKIFFNLFMLILFSRMIQKSVLKYQGDKYLPYIYEKYYKH